MSLADFFKFPHTPHLAWLSSAPARQGERLVEALGQRLMLFGEWCFAVHSVRYDALPDWFLAFDVYDREAGRFWSAARRDALLDELGLSRVPELARGRFSLAEVQKLLGPSRLTHGLMEGLYLRRDEGGFLQARTKLVRPEFVQAIEEHWSSRPLERNVLVPGSRG